MKDCHNTAGRIGRFGKPVKLHRLPSDKGLRMAWIRAISRKNFKPSGYTMVCSDHFPGGNGRTWRDDVPTLFLPQKAMEEPKLRTTANSKKGPWYQGLYADTQTEEMEAEQLEFEFDIHSYHKLESTDNGNSMDSRTDNVNNDRLDPLPEPDAPIPVKVDQSTQTPSTFGDSCVQVSMPEITIEDIKDSNEQVLFYTGLPDYCTFNALFESLIKIGADKMNIDDGSIMNRLSARKLRPVDEFLMVLMRLRLGLLLNDLEYRFKISASRISRIFNSWLRIMETALRSLVICPSLTEQHNSCIIPKCFKNFKDTRIILDCTEIFIETPSSLENKSLCYSHYKSHNTFKALVGITMTGAVSFVSRLYGGSASDVFITRNSGLLDILDKGDAVMVDKGFFHITSDLKAKGVKLYCPPFLSSSVKQFTKEQVECTRRVASARIHVERKMEQIKNFRILQGILPLSLSGIADTIFFVCSALTNLLPPLVK